MKRDEDGCSDRIDRWMSLQEVYADETRHGILPDNQKSESAS